MANVTHFDSKDLVVTVNGVCITGIGEDGVTGEKDEEFFSTSYGTQGDCVISTTNNDLGTVTIPVQKTSPQYSYLLGLAKTKDPFPIWCSNKSTNEIFGGSQCLLKNYPSAENGSEHSDGEFEFAVFDYEYTTTPKLQN